MQETSGDSIVATSIVDPHLSPSSSIVVDPTPSPHHVYFHVTTSEIESDTHILPLDIDVDQTTKSHPPENSGSDPGDEFDTNSPQPGWKHQVTVSLPGAHSSIPFFTDTSAGGSQSGWKTICSGFWSYFGCGLLVSVGYMDPGNWSTDLSGGASYGYTLLFVILLSNAIAIILQYLSLKLGVATERDLAQACHDAFPVWACRILWIVCEISIMATDLAEVLGSAIALKLLFGIPTPYGCLITAADVFLVLLLGNKLRSFRSLEVLVTLFTLLISAAFIFDLSLAKPNWRDVGWGLLPSTTILTNPDMLYNAIGILGATVMPHNLYLHSSIIQTRSYPRTLAGKTAAVKYGNLDSVISLMFAFFINAFILMLSAAAFHNSAYEEDVGSLEDAYALLSPGLGNQAASVMFGVALLASGQQSTITGTLTGEIVMSGFLRLNLPQWQRRLLTRCLAIVPAVICTAAYGERGLTNLLNLSQVILSLLLCFAVFPLVYFTSSVKFMSVNFVNSIWLKLFAWTIAFVLLGLNWYLIISFARNPTWES